MKTTEVKIAGRTFALAFTLDALREMQETNEDFDLGDMTGALRTPGGLLDMLTAMARQGELLEGRPMDVDRAWFGSHISPAPAKVAKIQIAVMTALADGLRMETEDEEQGEKDAVLEEIKKNGIMDG